MSGVLSFGVYGAALALIYLYLKERDFFSKKKKDLKIETKFKEQEQLQKNKNRMHKVLKFCAWFTDYLLPNKAEKDWVYLEYKLNRAAINIKYLNRNLKAKEYTGIVISISVVSALLVVVCKILGFYFLMFVFILTVATPFIAGFLLDANIKEEDTNLDVYFSDLFVLLHTGLTKGSDVRLLPLLMGFAETRPIYKDPRVNAIFKFNDTLITSISVYRDESMAVNKMRNTYKSATAINFCNLVAQALAGVDNRDKLLTFNIELQQRKLELMRQNSKRAGEKGRRVILLIYLILGEFVVLGWVSKLGGLGGLQQIFGMFK